MTCPPRRLRPVSVRHELSRRARPDGKECDVNVSGLKRFLPRLLDDEPAVQLPADRPRGGERADLPVPPHPRQLGELRGRVSTEGVGTSPIVPMPAGWTYPFWEQTGHAGCERLTLDAGWTAGGFRPDSDPDRG
jgi:hypothetical protein